ncbi:MFS transporter [Burkholderia plantarii]|uniref:ABC transporter, inner membrane protein n=1 Tax=Burkholderia plantarii TaxID=41899 RepID=A0A0B6RZP6_BURPL|nr:MFS transporter [Burkholderia plantarii]AJK47649.1 ABC transporter, inner membrane protein [Burkholderia plantarii]ALK31840.1 MFS superfamily transporter transmembrane protein [Burkholderia plantarii]WLE60564.1 MFS transporter [Burkholderia plantarii]GLZ21948.1 MFS transporter [Burkholderia plantarii]
MTTTSGTVEHDVARPSVAVSPAQARRALLALAVGGFGIGTGEFVIMGLLPDAARDLAITIPQAGHLISIYALGVVIGAPLLAVLGARWARRSFLVGLMLVFALGNLVSAIAPGFASMALARFLTGFPHGTFFGVAALVAAGLVPRERRTQAVALVFLGLTVATLLGVPIVAAIGQWFGWRIAFAIVGAIGLLSALLVRLWVPFMPGDALASPLRELGALRSKQVVLTLGIGAIGSGGVFSVFSYVKPTMTELAHLPVALVPVVLALFGLGMVTGNLAGSRFADRALEKTIRYVLIWAVVVMGAYTFSSHSAVFGPLNVLLVGTIVALAATLQTRLMDVAGDAQTLAAALNHAAFNIANALGAWLGGITIDAGLGWSSTGWVGSLLALAGIGVHAWALADQRKRHG